MTKQFFMLSLKNKQNFQVLEILDVDVENKVTHD